MWKKKEPIQQITPVQTQPEPIPVIRTIPQAQISPQTTSFKSNNKILKEEWKVVPELPTQPIREVTREDGTILHLITIDEAINLLLNE